MLLTNLANTSRQKAQLQSEKARRTEDLMRERGEELYELVDSWSGGLISHYLTMNYVMSGKLTYNQALEIDAKRMSGGAPKFARIEMLIDVYYPDARGTYDALIERRDQANSVVTKHKREYEKSGPGKSTLLDEFIAIQVEVENGIEALKKKIIALVRAA